MARTPYRTPYRNLFTPRNAMSAYRAAKSAYSGFQSARKMLYGDTKNASSGVVTTGQYDVKRQYRRKRMPRAKRRRWVKFAKKVTSVVRNDLAMQTWIVNDRLVGTTGDALPQNTLECYIYGLNGGSAGGRAMGTLDLNLLQAKYTDGSKLHYMFDHAVLDITINNASVATNGFIPSLEVDIYEVVYWDSTQHDSMYNVITDAALINTIDAVGSTKPSPLASRGSTLFDFPYASSVTKMKILKKTKVFLPAGNTATYQIRDNKKRNYGGMEIIDDTGFVLEGYTKGVFMIWKTVVNAGGVGGAQVNNGQLAAGATRTYYYKFDEANKFAVGYN